MNDDTHAAKSKPRLAREVEHGRELLNILEEKRRALEEQMAFSVDAVSKFALQKRLEEVELEIRKVFEQLESLSAEIGDKETPEETSGDKLFIPDWSVLRSEVRYVDANMAHQFADASEDGNIMLAFTTLFLGAGLSFAASVATADNPTQQQIFGTSLVFAVLLTIVFFVLWLRARKRAAQIKHDLFDKESESATTKKA